MPGPGALSNGRPYIDVPSGVQTLPQYRDESDSGAITFAVVANKIRLQFTGMTDAVWNLLNNSQYLLADNGAETSEVRAITYLEKIEGTPDTYFVVIDSPFTVAAASYDLFYVEPTDAQFTNTVVAGTEAVFVDGVEKIDAGQAVTFNPAQPFRPLVLYSDYPYKLSNGTFFFESVGGGGGGVESVSALNASVEVDNTDPLNPVVGLPYLVYRALLNQSGTDAPTAIVLENTLGEVPTFGYTNPGEYTLNTVGNVFTTNKTFLLVKSTPGFDWGAIFSAQVNGQNQVLLNVTNTISTNPVDGEFNNTSIEILVYS